MRLPGQNPIALTDFALKYYGLNFDGNEQARLRFYGPGATWYVLGDLIFDSGWISLPPAPTGDLLQFNNFIDGAAVPLTNAVPVDFTWIIEFQGIESGNREETGLFTTRELGRCGSVVVGPDWLPLSAGDYWQFIQGEWKILRRLGDALEPTIFTFLTRIEGEVAGLHFLQPALRQGEPVLTLVGESGRRYRIESSPDLAHWAEIYTATATNGVISTPVPAAGDCMFYRALMVE